MREQREIWQYVLSQVGGEARMFKLGTITDDSLGDKLRVTVVAAGFDSIESPIPGIQLKGVKGQPQQIPVIVEEPKEEIPEPVAVDEEELVLTGELEENTPTGSIDLVLEDERVTHGFEPINISLTEVEPTNDWTDEDALKMEMMIKSFRDGLVKFADLEGPAFRRSRVELWKRPAIPAHEMEQHWLK